MADITETVYIGYDNPIVLRLIRNAAAADLSDVTRIVVDCGTLEIDSDDAPEAVAWAGDTVTLRLGPVAGLAGLGTRATARLIVHTSAAPNGLVWIEKLKLTLKAPV